MTMRYRARDSRGFTLIDISIFMLVIGLMAAPLIAQYDRKIKEDNFFGTIGNRGIIQRAIVDYYYEFDRYPCPADLGLGPDDPGYGRESRNPGTGLCFAPSAAPPGSSRFVVTTGRDADGDGVGDIVGIGGVPFADLRLPASKTLDGWSGKFTYAVTRSLTDAPASQNLDLGAITVNAIDKTGALVVVSAGEAHFVLVSHGNNGIGGFSADGVLMAPCATGVGAPVESENCDGDATFMDNIARSFVPGPNYNDDVVVMVDTVPTRVWTNSAVDERDIVSFDGYVGVNTRNAEDPLHVVGNVMVDGVGVGSEKICDRDNDNCFRPKVIGGSGTRCAQSGGAVQPMIGVAYGWARCMDALPPNHGIVPAGCPADFAVQGIDAGGNIICVSMLP